MARAVTQETYDEIVQENMQEFDMSAEEAIKEAITQFETQGVDLTNIIKDIAMTSSTDIQIITNSIKKLESYAKMKSVSDGITSELDILKSECDKDIPHRIIAGKNGAYSTLIHLLSIYENEKEIIKHTFNTLVSLMTGQPDLLNSEGIDFMIKYIQVDEDEVTLHYILRWIRECCIKHEFNRQNIFDASIIDHLKVLLQHANIQVLKDVCAVLRALVLDDDIRVEFGKAHEHARIIASEVLCIITDLLTKFKHDEGLINEVLLTLSSLVVRNEFCKKVDDAGGLDFLIAALKEFKTNEKINRQSLRLLKVLAGNDECKAHIIQRGGANAIVESIAVFKESSQTVTFGFNTIAALTLRSPENSKALFEAGVPEIIVECMRIHPGNMQLQKSGSWAIRNMVSRSRYQSDKFLQLGVEEILQNDLKKFKENEYDFKAALRDLGCNVQLREEWTGKGGRITTEETK